eukprot:m.75601 g.75601  ORF g.75601 m.75601 type:complete len:348 (-) comp24804_c2_seq2:191-1234(-)
MLQPQRYQCSVRLYSVYSWQLRLLHLQPNYYSSHVDVNSSHVDVSKRNVQVPAPAVHTADLERGGHRHTTASRRKKKRPESGGTCVPRTSSPKPTREFHKRGWWTPQLIDGFLAVQKLPKTGIVKKANKYFYIELGPEWQEIAPTLLSPQSTIPLSEFPDIAVSPLPKNARDAKNMTSTDLYWETRRKPTEVKGIGFATNMARKRALKSGEKLLRKTSRYLKTNKHLQLDWYAPLSPLGLHISVRKQHQHLLGQTVNFQLVQLDCSEHSLIGHPSKFDPNLFHAYRFAFDIHIFPETDLDPKHADADAGFTGHITYACLGVRCETLGAAYETCRKNDRKHKHRNHSR